MTNNDNHEGLPDIAKASNDNPVWKAVLLVVGCLCFLGIYLWLQSNKEAKKTITPPMEENYSVATTQTTGAAAPRPISAAKPPELTEAQRQMILALEKEKQARLQAPVILVNNTQTGDSSLQANRNLSASADTNSQFLQQVSAQPTDTVKPTVMKNRGFMVAKGSMIFATLETEINSDLPGPVRAIVAEPVYAEDGSRVLIEAGSRLIGQYKSGMQAGQSRVFVVWTDIQKPNGEMMSIGSPGVDSLGTVGLGADAIDRHFLERFGTSGLLALMGAGAANVGVNNNDAYNAAQAYRQAVAQSFAQSANDAYKQNGAIPPTLHIRHGSAIAIFLMQHLDFTTVEQQARQKVNIF